MSRTFRDHPARGRYPGWMFQYGYCKAAFEGLPKWIRKSWAHRVRSNAKQEFSRWRHDLDQVQLPRDRDLGHGSEYW
jgi:hypothetical protein